MRDFSKKELLALLDVAKDIKYALHDRKAEKSFISKYHRPVKTLLQDIKVATLFVEKSTRTNFSSRAAVITAGGWVDGFTSEEDTSLKKGETWADTVAMFAGYGYDALVLRSTVEGLPRWTKEHVIRNHALLEEQHKQFAVPFSYQVPMVINAGDGKNQHPTQGLLDLYTLQEVLGSLDSLKIALLNDIAHARTHASLLSVAHHFNWEIHFAYPPRFGPRKEQLEDLVSLGVNFHDHGNDFLAAMRASQVAYHSRPQKERIKPGEDLVTIKEVGRLTKEKYDLLGKDAPWLMHPKPVDAEEFEEISADLLFHPKNITNLQASNGLYVRIASLAVGLGKIPWEYVERKIPDLPISLEELSLPENKKSGVNLRSGYVENSGVVLDHIPAGMGRRLAGVLGFEQQKMPQVISDYMPVREGRKPVKDMIKLHTPYAFSEEQYQAMALIAPEISVSFITEGKVVRKVRPHLGSSVTGRITCGNTACVTNVRKEHVVPKHHVEQKLQGNSILPQDSFNLRCHYCETSDTVEKAYQENRFVYMK